MRITLTLLRAAAEPVDLAVTVDGTATVGDVARRVADSDPTGAALAAVGGGTAGRGAGMASGGGASGAGVGGLGGQDPLTLCLHGPAGAPGQPHMLAPEAVAAETVRSGSVVSLARPSPTGARAEPAPAARLEVLDGPDAGLVIPLPEGTTVIGRGRGCDVRLSDPTVSQEHARLVVTDLVEIVDLRSANGLLLGDGLVQRAALLPQDTVALGGTTLRVTRIAAGRPAALDAAQVAFNRSPRVAPRYAGEEVEAPTPPDPPTPSRVPVVMLLAPLLMVPALLATGRDALSLVFLAMMPLMMAGHVLDQRVTGARTYRAAVARFTQTLDAVRAEREGERDAERAARRRESPSVGEATAAALALEPLLWSRRPEHETFLEVRLGLGTLPSRATITLPVRGRSTPECWDRVLALRRDLATVDDVPATARLRECGALGLAGPRSGVDGVARAVLAELVTLHSPAELVLTVATSAASAARWDWTKWLPHVGSAHSPIEGAHIGSHQAGVAHLVSRLEGLLDARRAQREDRSGGPLPVVVLLVEDDAPVERGRLVRIAEEGPAVGVHVLWCAARLDRLPAACRTFVAVGAAGPDGAAGYVQAASTVQPLRCEVLDADAAMALGRHLAAVVDAGAPVDDASDLPARVSFLALAGPETAQGPTAVLDRWRENGSLVPRDGSPPRRRRHDATLRALVGQGATEPFTLDLRTQGPHALVGGTTGAGKSEFLQAWVLGMATAYSPDRVTFLFVDYKGGSAFADCVDLPHAVGLVTDLSPHLVRRALTSLRAELRHRERLLGRRGAKDLLTLERTGDPACPPSLVVVVDEFAALATEVPEFVDGVVDVAQRGRSLGLHLVLATQRPAGVIRDNLRANTHLRVALRMNDPSDSHDVLGLPVAAGFDPAIPGRGAARTGPGRVTLFQAAYAGGRTADAHPRAQVDVESLVMGTGTRWEPPADPERGAREGPTDAGPTDIARLVESVSAAARAGGVPEPRKPWLPTLAPVQDLGALGPRTDAALVLGVVDDPARQRQVTAYYRPDVEGNIAFYGAAGSGKSTALRTLAVAAGITPQGGPVHVYGLDFSSGGLAALEGLPHVGAVIDGEDAERIQRLLRRLRETVEERSARYAAARASTVEEYRQIAARPDEPRLLLLVDGFGAFRTAWETAPGRSPWYQVFLQLLVDGRGTGVHVAVTADRPGAVPSSVAGSLSRRVVMRQVDEGGYLVLGAPKDVLDAGAPPGRAISPDGLEMQVAVLGGSATLAEQVRAVEHLSATLRRTGAAAALAPPVGRLPEIVPAEELPAAVDGLPVLGVADDTLAPLGVEPAGTFLLAGPPQSGRTNALRWLVESVRRARPEARVVYLGARRSALRGMGGWARAATGATEVAEVARAAMADVAEPPPEGQVGTVVVVEALADFLSTPAEGPLTELIRAAKRNEHFVIAEGDTSTWGSSWPLVAEIRSGRRGLALQPDQIEGDVLFRTAFPRVARRDFVVGRGLVVDRATVRRVQLPLAP
ncbi:FtsK/SpoIIIE domain-containing protein [Georgenia faecalis]|uniref:FtsK/SpoIIIE domain-containing protein n=1 Tax=Georgenia faecalis TaxID=2483799 RepID=UPI000FDBDF94|nr:FtsK/SpoIIIE domain-containing protein [Georgenia faecalis]